MVKLEQFEEELRQVTSELRADIALFHEVLVLAELEKRLDLLQQEILKLNKEKVELDGVVAQLHI